MRLLCSYELVDPGSSEYNTARAAGYGVHTCVHAWMMHVVNEEWDDELARVALSCVASTIPDTDVDGRCLTQKRLLLHVGRCNECVVDHKLDTRDMEWALHSLGLLYANQGKHKEAEAMYERALSSQNDMECILTGQTKPAAPNDVQSVTRVEMRLLISQDSLTKVIMTRV
jgi:tetratricopeptide (TPR) repeat protein